MGDWLGPRAHLHAVRRREVSQPCLEINPDYSGFQLIACPFY